MPVYEFRCEACGRDVEAYSTVAEHGSEKCPLCGSSSLIRAYRTAPAAHTVGCPSGTFRRLDNLNQLEAETNRKFSERNRDEMASAKWKVLDDRAVERGEDYTRKVTGLAPGAGYKPVHAARGA